MAAAGLMTLPFEVRSIIIRDAITLHRPPPRSPSASLDRKRLDILNTAIYVERSPDEAPARAQVSLLRACRQLRSDTRHVLASLRGETYVLDLMVVLDRGLLPTWCHVPGLQESIKLVTVVVRIFDPTPDLPSDWETHTYRIQDSAANSIQILLAQHIPRTCLHGHAAAAAAIPIPALNAAWVARCEWAAIHRLAVVVKRPRSLPAEGPRPWGADLLGEGGHECRTRLAEDVVRSVHRMLWGVLREESGVSKRYLMANVWDVKLWSRGGPARVFRVGKLLREHYRPDEIDVLPAVTPPAYHATLRGCRGWNHRSVERWRREGLWREGEPGEGGGDGAKALVGSATSAPDA